MNRTDLPSPAGCGTNGRRQLVFVSADCVRRYRLALAHLSDSQNRNSIRSRTQGLPSSPPERISHQFRRCCCREQPFSRSLDRLDLRHPHSRSRAANPCTSFFAFVVVCVVSVLIVECLPGVYTALRAALKHPNLLFTVYELNDASNEKCLEEISDSFKFGLVLIRKNESRHSGRLINQVSLPFFSETPLPHPGSELFLSETVHRHA